MDDECYHSIIQLVNTDAGRDHAPQATRPTGSRADPAGEPMRQHPTFLLAASMLALAALAACNPFRREPVTEVTRDPNLNLRWSAALVTPAALAGAVQMRGTASMQPGGNGQGTHLSVNVTNATPGGVHPWQVRRGQCGADEGAFIPTTAYKPLMVADDGRAESGTTVPGYMPTSGNYFVTVSASAANPEMIVACGNLAPPAR
jgi:hypothetical protein